MDEHEDLPLIEPPLEEIQEDPLFSDLPSRVFINIQRPMSNIALPDGRTNDHAALHYGESQSVFFMRAIEWRAILAGREFYLVRDTHRKKMAQIVAASPISAIDWANAARNVGWYFLGLRLSMKPAHLLWGIILDTLTEFFRPDYDAV